MKTLTRLSVVALLGIGAAAVVLPLGAVAQMRDGAMPGANPGGMMGGMGGMGAGPDFAAIDADGDGRLTAEEVRAHRAAEIEGLDADGDGFLSAEELAAHSMRMAETRAQQHADRMLQRLDADGDGRIGVAEMMLAQHGGMDMIARFDADGDGAVTADEIAEFRAQRQGRRDEMRGHRGGYDHDGRGHDRAGRGDRGHGHDGRGDDRGPRGNR